MSYEKKYTEALKRAKSAIKDCGDNKGRITMIEEIFPELKESEDERIRKEIMDFVVDNTICKDGRREKYLAWLEKQGEQKSIWHNEDEEPQIGSLILLIMPNGNPIVAKIIEPNHTFNHGERWVYIDDLLEKQDEKDSQVTLPPFTLDDILALQSCMKTAKEVQKDKDLYEKLNDLHGRVYDAYQLEKQCKPNPYSGVSLDYNGHIWGMCARDNGVEILFDGELKALLSLEKSFIYPIHPQPELAPKSAMEAIKEEDVEAKQKLDIEKGKWYVCNTPRYTDFVVGKAYNCPKRGMLRSNENEMARYVARDCFHIWSIDDAKDGDVLATHECLLLFKEIDGLNIRCYCTYHYLNHQAFFVDTLQNKTAFHPATKEQRDLLFEKMHEAGYEWDAEKLELKEIASGNAGQDKLPFIWHDATKGLPPKREGSDFSKNVFVHDLFGAVYISSYDYNGKCWMHNHDVIHWAYIPEPPKTE